MFSLGIELSPMVCKLFDIHIHCWSPVPPWYFIEMTIKYFYMHISTETGKSVSGWMQ